MYLEAITICVNFSDVLAHTLPANKGHFDRFVVVTDPNDRATWAVCRHHHVECISTDQFYHNDAAFNKGRGISCSMRQALTGQDWVLHLDADIVLPPRAREMLDRAQLDPTAIYGIDRMMCPSFEAWNAHVTNPTCQHPDQTFIIPEPFPMGPRVARLDIDGYVPIGFFQLWNAKETGILDYPEEHGTAGRTDMLHAMRWPRPKRGLIPEIIGIHLEGPIEPGKKNWRGRQMGPFGVAAAAPAGLVKGYAASV
jgi:hypothetical protein